MDQFRSVYPGNYIVYHFVVLHLIFWPLSLDTIPEQNSKPSSTTPADSRNVDVTLQNTMNSYTYDGTRPKQTTIATLSLQQQPATEPKPEIYLFMYP